ncbi:hypothetical protein FD755_009170 [Muntiacus reevesi]|uniref:Uncharacterized protein n=1 Tax=Muntiacus reevesi TaxID=9886 RepID=A0A5J5MLZ8_MUNRE|nr:hypothetical protein FD755_009170 [Muntiacus reevesi]
MSITQIQMLVMEIIVERCIRKMRCFEDCLINCSGTEKKPVPDSIDLWSVCIGSRHAAFNVKELISFLSQMRFIDRQYTHRSTAQRGVKVCWVHHVTGMWVYPFLEHIGPGARILFFGSTTILMNFLYLLGEVLNSYIWDTQRRWSENQERKKPA